MSDTAPAPAGDPRFAVNTRPGHWPVYDLDLGREEAGPPSEPLRRIRIGPANVAVMVAGASVHCAAAEVCEVPESQAASLVREGRAFDVEGSGDPESMLVAMLAEKSRRGKFQGLMEKVVDALKRKP